MDRLIALSKNAQNGNAVENGGGSDDEEEDGSEEGSDEEGDEEEEEESGEEDAFSDLVYESDSEAESSKSKETSLKKSADKKSIAAEPAKSTKVKVLTEEERKAMMEKAQKELPYTFELPSKYNELEKLLKKHRAEYQAVILGRASVSYFSRNSILSSSSDSIFI